MATGYLADGTKLYCDPAGGSTYAELADTHSITATYHPKYVTPDVTPLSESGNIRSKKIGLGEPGQLSFKQFWTAARELVLETPYFARTLCAWRVEMPDSGGANGTRDSFSGYIIDKHIEGTGSPDEPLMIAVTVQVTGAITRGASA